MRVANLVFNPFVNDSRVLKESTSLSNNGYEVEVIAHLNKNLSEEEKKHNFTIKRFSYLDRTVTKSMFYKLLAYIKYAVKCISYCKNFDCLHCNDLNTLPIGVIIKLFLNKKVKVIYDAHEYETEVHGLSGVKKRIIYFLEKSLIRYADKVITVSDTIAIAYAKLYNIEKPKLVLNTPNLQKIDKQNLFREELSIGEKDTIYLYQGGLSSGRGIEIILKAFEQIEDKSKVVIFMGYGALERLVKKYACENKNIYFKEAVNPDVLLNYTCSADYGISLIEDTCLNYRFCLPNKVFEYIMANLPLIVSDLPEMRKLVEEYNVGVAVEGTVEGLVKGIEYDRCIDKKQLEVNLKKVQEIYNWENQEKVLIDLYKKL